MTILEQWDQRLTNWALWYVSGSRVGNSSYDPGEWWKEPPRNAIPLVGEALDTDRLVSKLIPEQFTAVRAWYVWTGTGQMKARSLKIHYDTLCDRVRSAKYRLDDLAHASRPRVQPRRDPGMLAFGTVAA